MENYIQALTEGLEKKLDILKKIHESSLKQSELLSKEPLSFEEFDKLTEDKGYLIYKLNKLDEGFETVFSKVKDELEENREAHKDEIRRMQELIKTVTEESNAIQALEARNKASVEQHFAREKSKIRNSRSSAKALRSYSQAMTYKK